MTEDFRLRTSLWGSFVSLCCVVIHDNLLEGSCKGIPIQPWTHVIDYSLLGLTWYIRLRIAISYLSISGIVVHGRCYSCHCFFFLLFFWLFVGWSLFVVVVFMSLDSNLKNQERILTFLFSFWLIIKLYHY